jgi:hypothetical protein
MQINDREIAANGRNAPFIPERIDPGGQPCAGEMFRESRQRHKNFKSGPKKFLLDWGLSFRSQLA